MEQQGADRRNKKNNSGGSKFFIRPQKQQSADSKNNSFFIRPQKKNIQSGETSNREHESNQQNNIEKIKKPFDKKKWRIKKYSNKYKVEKWEDERKKKVLHRYHKEMKHENQGFDVQKIYAEDDNNSGSEGEISSNTKDADVSSGSELPETTKKTQKPKMRLQEKFLKLKQEKIQMKEEAMDRKAKREEAMKLYKQKKAERYRKLNKKTKKGQPIMKDRLEMLLEKIQSSCQGENP